MKISKLVTALCLVIGIAVVVQAQTLVDDIAKEWERAKVYTKEYLDAMPESGYALK